MELQIHGQADIDHLRKALIESSARTRLQVSSSVASLNPLELLFQMKFAKIGCDPIDSARHLNLIEQLNQTFTYEASLRAAEYLFRHHSSISLLNLHLGATAGWDIEGAEDGGLVAEVFAAVNPKNNRKLEKDIAKVSKATVPHRYVFFMCPDIVAGPYRKHTGPPEIQVVSLGCDFSSLCPSIPSDKTSSSH
jgi:hypothetical protein